MTTGMLQDVLNRSYKEGCLNPDSKRKSRGNLIPQNAAGHPGCGGGFCQVGTPAQVHSPGSPEDEDLTVPKGARLKGRKILQPDSLRVLLSTDTRVVRGKVEQDENVHAYRIAVMTGLRPGELLGLRVGDLDGDGCTSGGPSTARTKRPAARTRTPSAPWCCTLWLWPRSAPSCSSARRKRSAP